jgi:hypothetical protein
MMHVTPVARSRARGSTRRISSSSSLSPNGADTWTALQEHTTRSRKTWSTSAPRTPVVTPRRGIAKRMFATVPSMLTVADASPAGPAGSHTRVGWYRARPGGPRGSRCQCRGD